jgi:tRNA-Thr(GGU) m(6)t(6)A37 methyltransferase TsaA
MRVESPRQTEMTVTAIGTVFRENDMVRILIDEKYHAALKQLNHFSHVIVMWTPDKIDEDYRHNLTCRPPYAPNHETGVFASRAEYRPNPIAITVCPIVSLDEENGVLVVKSIDAYDGSPVLDLKAYFPVLDRVKDPQLPEWLDGWPEWLPDDGIGIME